MTCIQIGNAIDDVLHCKALQTVFKEVKMVSTDE